MVRVEPGAIPPVSLREDADGNETQAIEDLATGSVELTSALWNFYRRARVGCSRRGGSGYGEPLLPLGRGACFGAVVLRDHIREAAAEGKKGPIVAFAVSYHPFETDPEAALVDENTATELLLGYDFDNEGAVEAIMQVLSLLSAKYPVLVEVDDSMEALVQVTDVLLRAGTASVEGDPTYIYVTE